MTRSLAKKCSPIICFGSALTLWLPNLPAAVLSGTDALSRLAKYDVQWTVPGPSSAESMPLGNGDIGLNVWTETNGDVLFYIGKSDSWGEVVQADEGGLMKLGRVRVSLTPNPLASGAPFSQTLHLNQGDIVIQEGTAQIRLWVDANHPVIRVETASAAPVKVAVSVENWRPAGPKDILLADRTNEIVWYHRNAESADRHVANLTFGASLRGEGLLGAGARLETPVAVTNQNIAIYPLTAATPTAGEWLQSLSHQVALGEAENVRETRQAHELWWRDFWLRSFILISGDAAAEQDTAGYAWQRFVTACAGRGAFPIKFNGSIFVVDNPALQPDRHRPAKAVSADYRTWGGQYWFQNTRPMYWPRLAAGDFDLMQPLFRMYVGQLGGN